MYFLGYTSSASKYNPWIFFLKTLRQGKPVTFVGVGIVRR
jgi:hypothetical protein